MSTLADNLENVFFNELLELIRFYGNCSLGDQEKSAKEFLGHVALVSEDWFLNGSVSVENNYYPYVKGVCEDD